MSKYRYVTVDGRLPEQPKSWLNLDMIQHEIREWQDRNFPMSKDEPMHPFLGVIEEMGELAHSILKSKQGIRGTAEEHEAKAKDAIGDLMVFLLSFCDHQGWRLSDLIEETWLYVQQRDWTKDKTKGGIEANV